MISKYRLSDLSESFSEPFDILICSASFEDRSVAFSNHYPSGQILQSLIFYMKENQEFVESALRHLEKLYSGKSKSFGLSRNNPLETADIIISALKEAVCQKKATTVLVDITSFTHEVVLMIYKILKEYYPELKAKFVYVSAGSYNPSNPKYEISIDESNNTVITIHKNYLDSLKKGVHTFTVESEEADTTYTFNTDDTTADIIMIIPSESGEFIDLYVDGSVINTCNKWLSHGVKEIRTVLGFSGEILPILKTHLIIIVGYEYERAASIITNMEPFSLSLVFGESGSGTTPEKNWGAKDHFETLTKNMLPLFDPTKLFTLEIPCAEPIDAMMILKEHIEQFKNENIVIVPLNNKITTLSAGMLATENERIQICYAPALLYNYSDYSTVGDSVYLIQL